MTKDGRERTILKSADLLHDQDGKIIGGIECFEDITERQIIGLQQENSEKNYRSFFDTIDDLFFIADQQGFITYVNSAVSRKLGYSFEEVTQMHILDVHPSEKRSEAEKILTDMVAGQRKSCPLPLAGKSGKHIPVETRIWFGMWDGVECIFGISKDLSAQQAALDKFYKIFDNNPALMAVSGMHDGRFIEVNATFLEKLGYEKEEIIGKTAKEIGLFADEKSHKSAVNNLENNGVIRDVSLKIRKKSGEFLDGLFSGVVIDNQFQKAFITVMMDMTEQRQAVDALRISEEKYSTIFEESPIAIQIYDREGQPIHVNNACLELFGAADIIEMEKLNLLKQTQITPQIYYELQEKRHVRFEKVLDFDQLKSQQDFNSTCSGIKYLDISVKSMLHEKKVNGCIVQILDITGQRTAQQHIEYLIYHDDLTGLYNRSYFEQKLVELDHKQNLPLTLVMADVNGLKLINDSFGHNMGDELLRKTADILQVGCKQGGTVARLGGDEFAIILPCTADDEANDIIRKIKELASCQRVKAVDISISFGWETKSSETQSIQEVFKFAEDHMYRNKLYESASLKSKMINLIMNALYQKSSREKHHSERVSLLCEKIAERLEVGQDMVNQIRAAGLMHDIGKMGIDDQILNKPGALSEAEWNEIKRHPEIGYHILSSSNEFSELAMYVLEHQEKWDGTGYPKGTKGEAISMQARIIAVADAFDAMTGERTYRMNMTTNDAVEEIRKHAGRQFDPDIAKVLIELMSEN